MQITEYGMDITWRDRIPNSVKHKSTKTKYWKGELIVKKINSEIILLVVAGLLLFSATNVQAIPTLILEAPLTVSQNQTFQINVFANGVTIPDELLAFGFDVGYDSSFTLFENDVAVLPDLPPGYVSYNDSVLFPNTDVAGSVFPGISGDSILLASLMFSATTLGTYSIGIFSDSSDLNEGLITLLNPKIDFATAIDINVVSVPEPSTIFLLSLGLVGASVARIRHRFN